MGKIICYGFENGKLWFGKVTFRSLVRAFFRSGGSFEVKPIKGYEQYSYYEDRLYTEIGNTKLTNCWIDKDPIRTIAFAEGVPYQSLKAKPPIH